VRSPVHCAVNSAVFAEVRELDRLQTANVPDGHSAIAYTALAQRHAVKIKYSSRNRIRNFLETKIRRQTMDPNIAADVSPSVIESAARTSLNAMLSV